MSRARLNLIALGVFVAILGGGYFFWWEWRSPKPTPTSNGATGAQPRDTIKAIGRIEPEGGITDVSGTTGERIKCLKVHEGEHVDAGQLLAELGSVDLRQSELELAEIQLDEGKKRLAADRAYGLAVVAEANAAVEQLKLAKLDEEALKSKVDSLKLKVSIAEGDYARLERTGKEIISDQELQHQELVIAGAKSELEAADSQLKKFKDSLPIQKREADAKLATALANQERLSTGVQIRSLDKQVDAARQKLELAKVCAPHEGTVLRIITTKGELIGQRPILLLGNTKQMYVNAEVYETDIRYVRKGQRVKIRIEALDTDLMGTVESIGRTVAKNEALNLDPTASADNRVVKVSIKIDESDSGSVSGLVDLQVDVTIDTSGKGFAEQGKPGNGG